MSSSRVDRTPRRRLDAEVRRSLILDAAARRFGERPYALVSVADIAQDAEASEALVFRYFASKADLYAAVVARAIQALGERQRAALAALPQGVPVRDRVQASLEVYLDHIAEAAPGWAAPFTAAGNDPEQALEVRRAARAAFVEELRSLLGVTGWARHEYALWGYFGFLDGACLAWVERGCPDDERHPLMDAALGALEGALGDWSV